MRQAREQHHVDGHDLQKDHHCCVETMIAEAQISLCLSSLKQPFVIVVMGVCACGKSTVAARLAAALGGEFLDADAFHSTSNVAKMKSGVPLSDDDRGEWLESLRVALQTRAVERGASVVLACSALKRRYRDVLQSAHDTVCFVHLVAPQSVIEERVRRRTDHFMPVSLVASQFDALEALQADEPGGSVDVSVRTVDEIVHEARMSGRGRRKAVRLIGC
jgi:gluconokinase